MYYLGIDYSSTNTGLVFLYSDGVNEQLIKYKLLSPPFKDFDERILWIWDNIYKEVQFYDTKELQIAIESPSFYSKGRVVDLAAGFGYIKYNLLKLGYVVETYTPSNIKKFATGKGRLPKSDDKRLKHTEMLEALPKDIQTLYLESEHKKLDDIIDATWLAKLQQKGN